MSAVRTRRLGGVLEVTLDRPPANAIDLATSRAMGEVFAAFRDDRALRVAVLRTAGERFFSAGWDLKAAAAGDAVDGDYGVGGFGGIQELPGLDKPVHRARRGHGGRRRVRAGPVLRPDLRGRHGVVRAPGDQRGHPRRRGDAAPAHPDARTTSRWSCCSPAAGWTPPRPTGGASSTRCTRRRGSPSGCWRWRAGWPRGRRWCYAAIKEVQRESQRLTFAEAMRRIATGGFPTVAALYASEDQREGAQAFAEKRPPIWRGE